MTAAVGAGSQRDAFEPQVVHFSGHGDRDGRLYVENESGESALVTPEGLADLFGQHKSTIRCVIVNACHSVRLAEALASRIDHVIGMRHVIGDAAAIEFSFGFYLALFAGWSGPDPAASRQGLEVMLSDADKAQRRANYAGAALWLNHLIAAADALRAARIHNIPIQRNLELKLKSQWKNGSPGFRVTLAGKF